MINRKQEDILQDWDNNYIEPLVSISCLTYNHSEYIEQCLDSLLMQKTKKPFEILIHDDCSTDGTTEIIRKYESNFPLIIKPYYEIENQYSIGNKFGSKEWNFPRAKGKYIAICEGDDFWTDEKKLQKQIDFLENNLNYTITCHNAILISNNENKGLFNKIELPEELMADDLILNWSIPTASMLFRKEVCDIIPTIDGLIQGDILMYLSAISIGRCHYDNKIMSAYRVNNPKSVSSSFSQDYLTYYKRMKKAMFDIDKAFDWRFHNSINRLQKKYNFYIFRFWVEKKIPSTRIVKRILKSMVKK